MTDDQAQMIDKFHEGQTEGLHAVMRDNMSLQKEIADLKMQALIRENEAKPKTWTGRETMTGREIATRRALIQFRERHKFPRYREMTRALLKELREKFCHLHTTEVPEVTDLETLTEAFEKMGMEPNKEADLDGSGTVSLCISHVYFSFTERGAFLGIDTYENAHKRMVASGYFTERIPIPEE